ncbi:hypothetical protein ACFY5F_36115 [Streptomyces sp. NPDC013161]|uniref:hypothetical protein n=1 Tax=Streptomyces sp. NPDC013161 TaxID=3364862 RepID=UPI0036C4AF16
MRRPWGRAGSLRRRPAELRHGGKYSKNPLEEAGFAAMARRLPSVLARTARMAWAIDRRGVLLLAGCEARLVG